MCKRAINVEKVGVFATTSTSVRDRRASRRARTGVWTRDRVACIEVRGFTQRRRPFEGKRACLAYAAERRTNRARPPHALLTLSHRSEAVVKEIEPLSRWETPKILRALLLIHSIKDAVKDTLLLCLALFSSASHPSNCTTTRL